MTKAVLTAVSGLSEIELIPCLTGQAAAFMPAASPPLVNTAIHFISTASPNGPIFVNMGPNGCALQLTSHKANTAQLKVSTCGEAFPL